jgi:hypothetical protein
VARHTAIGRGQWIAAKLRFREYGAHTEAQNIGGQHRLQEQYRKCAARDRRRLAAAHGDYGCAKTAGGEQGDEHHQQQVAGQKEGDTPVARARLGPQKLVTQADELADQRGVHIWPRFKPIRYRLARIVTSMGENNYALSTGLQRGDAERAEEARIKPVESLRGGLRGGVEFDADQAADTGLLHGDTIQRLGRFHGPL